MKKRLMALITAGMVTASTLSAGFATTVPVAASDYGWGDLLGDLSNLYDYDQQMQDAGLTKNQRDAVWALGILGGLAEAYDEYTNGSGSQSSAGSSYYNSGSSSGNRSTSSLWSFN